MRYKVFKAVYTILLSVALLSPFLSNVAYAACVSGDPTYPGCIQKDCEANNQGVYISLPISSPAKGTTDPGLEQPLNDPHCIANNSQTLSGNPIFYYAIHIIPYLTAGVGIGVTAGIVWGGILYTTAAGNTGQTLKAQGVIRGAVLALIIYILSFAIINFLVPGGIVY